MRVVVQVERSPDLEREIVKRVDLKVRWFAVDEESVTMLRRASRSEWLVGDDGLWALVLNTARLGMRNHPVQEVDLFVLVRLAVVMDGMLYPRGYVPGQESCPAGRPDQQGSRYTWWFADFGSSLP